MGVHDDSFYFVLSLADRDRQNERRGKEKEGERGREARQEEWCAIPATLLADSPL